MRSAYGAKGDEIGQHAATIVVDVANVMGSRPDGWWRDRAGAAVRLYAELTALAASGRAILPDEPGEKMQEFVMVLEGAARPAADRIAADRIAADPIAADPIAADPIAVESGPGGVQLVLAGGSGDDTIVALARELPGRRFVVTADRELQRRCVAAGAEILRPSWLISQLREPLSSRNQVVIELLSGRPARSTGRPHSPSRPGALGRQSGNRNRQRRPGARLTRIREVWKML
jgi:hypothetical protein